MRLISEIQCLTFTIEAHLYLFKIWYNVYNMCFVFSSLCYFTVPVQLSVSMIQVFAGRVSHQLSHYTHTHKRKHNYRPFLNPFTIILGLLPQTGIQLQDLNSSPWQGGLAFLCDRVPLARLLSAQCVTLLEFAGPPVSASSCSTMRRGEPQLRLAPSAAWCPSE